MKRVLLKHLLKETKSLNDKIREGHYSERQLEALAAFGFGPKYKPVKNEGHECPKCKKKGAKWHEAHADTGMDEMELNCPTCGNVAEEYRRLNSR